MRTARLEIVRASVATRCQSRRAGRGGGPMNEFEQVSVQSIMGNSGQDDRQTDMTENITFP